MKRIWHSLALAIALAATLAACAGQQERILESSGGKPGWVSDDRDAFDDGDRRFYKAVVDRQKGLDLASDRARFAAIRRVSDEVNLRVVSEFGETTNGVSNDVDNPSGDQGNAILRSIAAASKATLSGVTPEKAYWEKWQVKTQAGEDAVVYKVYCLVSIAKRDLTKARIAATEAGVREADRAQNAEAKARLDKTLEDLRKEGGN